MLKDMDMHRVKNVYAMKLSGGQKRKLSIIEAIVYGSKVSLAYTSIYKIYIGRIFKINICFYVIYY